MNSATKIVTENAVAQWTDMGFPDDYRAEAAELKDYYTRLMEDFCENYDEQWFALIATPAVQKTIDWEAVAEAVNNMLAENQDDEEDDVCGCGKCRRCLADDTCAGQCGDQGNITVISKSGNKFLVCRDCCDWFKREAKEFKE